MLFTATLIYRLLLCAASTVLRHRRAGGFEEKCIRIQQKPNEWKGQGPMTVKIAVLPNVGTQERVFTEEIKRELEQLGEVVYNDSASSDAETVKKVIAGADIAITSWGVANLDANILDAAPNLKAVIHAAGSVKPVVSQELWNRGIRVSSGNGPLGIGVAETALALTITSLKNMWRIREETREGGWREEKKRTREMYGVTIGVIGAGKAGRHFIKLLKNFDVHILLADPVVSAEQAQELGVEKVELDELMSRSDVVSIHAPSIPATYKMINRERLALMKDGAILINTARGSIVDEEALAAELETERLFACIDVTDPEPPAADHPFRKLRNCVLTSHIAGAVTNGIYRIGRFAVQEVERFLKGEKMEGEVYEKDMSVLA
jgi:phosphoglycerate dehydrogenase-like enzyme